MSLLLVAACGTTAAPASENPASENPAGEAPTEEAPAQAESAATEDSEALVQPNEDEARDGETADLADGPRNFLTPHRCHPPGPCTFEFEALRGAQHIDVGHGHVSAPHLDIVLRIHDGVASLDGLSVSEEQQEARGVVVARSRDSLEGDAFYVTLNGDARDASLELSFRLE